MSKDITILIPTHFRHHILPRTLAFFKDCGLSVVVADSTTNPFTGDLQGAHYLHLPADYASKMLTAIQTINTPYLVFCADDDLTSPLSIMKCRDFLERNPDYISAQGRFACCQQSGETLLCRPTYEEDQIANVTSDSPNERMIQIFNPYVPTYYAVHRRNNWHTVFDVITKSVDNVFLMEVASAMIFAMLGKHKSLSTFHTLRTETPTVDRKKAEYTGLSKILRVPEENNELLTSFHKSLAVTHASLFQQPVDESLPIVKRSFQTFVSTLNTTPKRTFIQKIPKYIKQLGNSVFRQKHEARQQEAREQKELVFTNYKKEFSKNSINELDRMVQTLKNYAMSVED